MATGWVRGAEDRPEQALGTARSLSQPSGGLRVPGNTAGRTGRAWTDLCLDVGPLDTFGHRGIRLRGSESDLGSDPVLHGRNRMNQF